MSITKHFYASDLLEIEGRGKVLVCPVQGIDWSAMKGQRIRIGQTVWTCLNYEQFQKPLAYATHVVSEHPAALVLGNPVINAPADWDCRVNEPMSETRFKDIEQHFEARFQSEDDIIESRYIAQELMNEIKRLNALIKDPKEDLAQVGEVYRHTKTGNLYTVLAIGVHRGSKDDGSKVVIYTEFRESDGPLGQTQIHVRPLEEWGQFVQAVERRFVRRDPNKMQVSKDRGTQSQVAAIIAMRDIQKIADNLKETLG